MNVFLFDDYKELLKKTIESNKQTRGLKARLSEAAGCQKSYLSQVLSSHAHLTLEHASGICDFFNYSEEESSFFLDLVAIGKTDSNSLRKKLKARIDLAKERHFDIQTKINSKRLKENQKAIYYSHWLYSAVHILLSIPKYQTLKNLSQRLSLKEDKVLSILEKLEEFELVQRMENKWFIKPQGLHIPHDSPLVSHHHHNWRQQAVLDSQNSKNDSIHYTSASSMSLKDFEILKQKIQTFMIEMEQTIQNSQEEELFCFNCDFFRA